MYYVLLVRNKYSSTPASGAPGHESSKANASPSAHKIQLLQMAIVRFLDQISFKRL